MVVPSQACPDNDSGEMVLFLTRQYFHGGTNGKLRCAGRVICSTIELPWRQNRSGISCIPEGKYGIARRYSRRFGWHLEVVGVPDRSLILIHPANNAQLELRGCIAPVTVISGAGLGLQSRKACAALAALVFAALEREEEVMIVVESLN